MRARAAIAVFALAIHACGGDDVSTADGAVDGARADGSPRRDAPGLDAPGLDAAGLDAAGLDAPIEDGPRPDRPPGSGGSIRFYGNGGTYGDRVRIRVDDPATSAPGPSVDVGETDFTIEAFIRATATDNPNDIACGPGISWVMSNIFIDRDRHGQPPTFGVGVAGGSVIFAVLGPDDDSYTLCGTESVLDGGWHHVAVQRRASDGRMEIFVDGIRDAMVDGPDGNIAYPDDGVPLAICPGGSCDYSDPFLVIGAEKHGYPDISFNGSVDELRVSTVLRYGTTYAVPTSPFAPDGDTVGLYHFDDGARTTATDASGDGNHGELRRGGSPPGPDWQTLEPF